MVFPLIRNLLKAPEPVAGGPGVGTPDIFGMLA